MRVWNPKEDGETRGDRDVPKFKRKARDRSFIDDVPLWAACVITGLSIALICLIVGFCCFFRYSRNSISNAQSQGHVVQMGLNPALAPNTENDID